MKHISTRRAQQRRFTMQELRDDRWVPGAISDAASFLIERLLDECDEPRLETIGMSITPDLELDELVLRVFIVDDAHELTPDEQLQRLAASAAQLATRRLEALAYRLGITPPWAHVPQLLVPDVWARALDAPTASDVLSRLALAGLVKSPPGSFVSIPVVSSS